jgi:hypothetical protein
MLRLPFSTAPCARSRPSKDPEDAVVLNLRVITRESLYSSVPAALKPKRRIKCFALDNGLDHLPLGDMPRPRLSRWESPGVLECSW